MKLSKEEKIKLKELRELNKKQINSAKKIVSDFKSFAFRGNILDLAIGLVIGTAFTKIVNSLVNEILMPLFSSVTGKIDYTTLFVAVDGKHYETIEEAKAFGIATINYGTFISSIIDFLVMAIVIYIFMKYVFKKRKIDENPKEKTTKNCPACTLEIPVKATRCPHCTTTLEENK